MALRCCVCGSRIYEDDECFELNQKYNNECVCSDCANSLAELHSYAKSGSQFYKISRRELSQLLNRGKATENGTSYCEHLLEKTNVIFNRTQAIRTDIPPERSRAAEPKLKNPQTSPISESKSTHKSATIIGEPTPEPHPQVTRTIAQPDPEAFFKPEKLACENCGARVLKSADSSACSRYHQAKQKKKVHTNASVISFVAIGSLAVILLVIVFVFIIRNASLQSDPHQVNSGSAETTLSTPDEFNSAEEKTAYWQSVYRSYLEQLIPERMSDDIYLPILSFGLVDLNSDDIPELVDAFTLASADSDLTMRVYYIDNGAIRQLGEVSLHNEHSKFFAPAKFFEDTGASEVYVSQGEFGSASYGGQELSIWRSQIDGTLSFERILVMQYSDDANILSEYVDPSAIEYDNELDRYSAYSYNGLFVTKQEYEGYATALDERIISHYTPNAWIYDDAEKSESGSFEQLVASGMAPVAAANTVIDRLFERYPYSSESTN